jgi:hypothetical protein
MSCCLQACPQEKKVLLQLYKSRHGDVHVQGLYGVCDVHMPCWMDHKNTNPSDSVMPPICIRKAAEIF